MLRLLLCKFKNMCKFKNSLLLQIVVFTKANSHLIVKQR